MNPALTDPALLTLTVTLVVAVLSGKTAPMVALLTRTRPRAWAAVTVMVLLTPFHAPADLTALCVWAVTAAVTVTGWWTHHHDADADETADRHGYL